MNLKGKVALITGGGTGIGEAIARRFVADGAKVCITGRRAEILQKVAGSLPEKTVLTCPGSVAEPEDIERMVAKTMANFGKIDVLVNSAGISVQKNIVDTDTAEWRKILETNLFGPYLLMKAVIPHFIKNGGGSVINIASTGGFRCIPNASAYCTSKAGLIMLTQQTAVDFGRQNIRCNVVCPGLTKTPMIEGPFSGLAKMIGIDLQTIYNEGSKSVPVGRLAEPDEMTGICSLLASDEASYMTGMVIPVDGGMTTVDHLASNLGAFIGSKMGGH